MAIQRMDNVLIVVEDLERAIAFFVEIGMELEGRQRLDGDWAGRVVGLGGIRQESAMLRIPGAAGGIELCQMDSPTPIRPEPWDAPANTLGLRRVMFAVDDLRDTVGRLADHGAELVAEIVQYEQSFLLCYVRGPENIIVGLAQALD